MTSDDYRHPHSDSESFVTQDATQAINIAATKILTELIKTGFSQINKEDKDIFLSRDPIQVWEWYARSEEVFVGKYVPITFSVSISKKSVEVDSFDQHLWKSLCDITLSHFNQRQE